MVGAKNMNNVVPFNELNWQWHAIKDKFLPEFHNLVNGGHFCLGPYVEQFEQQFAEFVGSNYAIGVNSGTSAIHLALIAAGIQPGDKVLVPAQTFIATIWAILYIGAIPLFCDVEYETGNIDIVDAEKKVTSDTKAIIPVHLYGQPANLNKIINFANQYQLKVIEDACQAHGAVFNNKQVGTHGLLGCFSFYPGKNLGAFGEGGIIVTNDEPIAKRLSALRQHAQHERYVHEEVGYNYRMEGIQGLVLSQKLVHLIDWTNLRRKIAQQYLSHLSDLPLQLPYIINQDHVYHLFVIRTPHRDSLRSWLQERNIMTGLHYPVPLHQQPCLKFLNHKVNDFPITNEFSNHGLSLPIFAGMTDIEVERVIEEIRLFFKNL